MRTFVLLLLLAGCGPVTQYQEQWIIPDSLRDAAISDMKEIVAAAKADDEPPDRNIRAALRAVQQLYGCVEHYQIKGRDTVIIGTTCK